MDSKKTEENKTKIAQEEEATLAFWNERQIFKKTLEKEAPAGVFTFYDGPPFANGEPHYGHILAGTIKDIIPRFKTMQGFRVPRRWGWDCHGLPVENLVEKELGLQSKKDIEQYGLEKFNEVARESVMRYADVWRSRIPRFGRFVDMDDDYRTMDTSYTESVWWAFKSLYEKDLIYEGFKPMHLCPHCGTTLSNFEVSQGYKDITDISVYVKFELVDEPGTFLLAWTTTPWTLPGNVALAVGNEIGYVKVSIGNEKLILAKERLGVLKGEYSIVEEMEGKRLAGRLYKPLFDYYSNDSKLKNRENGWKIYPADFVTTEDGTGIVHIAPAFGEDDMKLGEAKQLPFVQHVGMDGKFKKEVSDFAGESVKPKEDPQRTDVLVLKYLAAKNILFDKQKITHSYPHCWRCDTPLLNYAASSWFVKVTAFRDKLVSENKKIHWVPSALGEYRFGNWLSEARDWAISRTRFWGAPLPVWRCQACGKTKFIGSIAELTDKPPRNEYLVMRHGEAENNVASVLSTNPENPHHLTEKGKQEILKSAQELKGKGIDLIFVSPFVRTKESAELIREVLQVSKESIIVDNRLREISAKDFEGKSVKSYQASFKTLLDRFKDHLGGENYMEIKNRMAEFLYETDEKYLGKKILIISHEAPLWLLMGAAKGLAREEIVKGHSSGSKESDFVKNGEVKEVKFVPLPHNKNYELDLHRPYIDAITFPCDCSSGGVFKRVSEVFDCWFESGSMPFAEAHYPFEHAEVFNPKGSLLHKTVGFPADFIAEGVDQTRGWFYSMLVLSVALFGKTAYKNVIVNGTVLAENGQKMSKRLKNYPDPMKIVNTYGADAMRYYLAASPVMRAEDFRFSEKGVDEVLKKVIQRLQNVLAFYELYAGKDSGVESKMSEHVLDIWILARLDELISEVTANLEAYELDRAARPICDFVDDLSTWYLRRSRDRFKGDDPKDKAAALKTIRAVLETFSKIIAPFMPFLAEAVYGRVVKEGKESVHLESWPKPRGVQKEILADMQEVRRIVSLALEERAKANIKVRQPLQKIQIKDLKLAAKPELLTLITDEVNVKEVEAVENLGNEVVLDVTLTEALKEEGVIRDFIRVVQEYRKKIGLTVKDQALLTVSADAEVKTLVEKYQNQISKTTLLRSIEFGETNGETVEIGDFKFIVSLSR